MKAFCLFHVMFELRSVLRTTLKGYQFSAQCFGDLLHFAHTHVLAVNLEVYVGHSTDDVARGFCAVYKLLAFPKKILPAMMSSSCLGVPLSE